MKHRLLICLLLGPMLLLGLDSRGRADAINVKVNDRLVNFATLAPVRDGGRVLVPMRSVFEALGAMVEYDAATDTIRAARGNTHIQLPIGKTTALINDVPKTLDVPAKKMFGTTMVPLRFVGDAFGAQVLWDEAHQTVLIIDAGAPNPNPNPNVTPGPTPAATPAPTPVPTAPPVTVSKFTATVVRVDPLTPPSIILRAGTAAAKRYDASETILVKRATTGPLIAGIRPSYSTPVQIPLSALVPGEEVEVTLNAQGQVEELLSHVSLVLVKVKTVDGNTITLDGDQQLVVGTNLRFINALGQPAATPDLQAGQNLALFLSPGQAVIYQGSAAPADITAAQKATGAVPVQPAAGTPRILVVNHDAKQPLREGANLTVTIQGTPKMIATFDVGQVHNQKMTEDPDQPGVYTGTYTIQAGDDVLNGRVTAHLVDQQGREDIQQSRNRVDVDTLPPRLVSVVPTKGSVIENALPNVVVQVDDLGGTGVGKAVLTLKTDADKQDFNLTPSTADNTGVQSVSTTPDRPLSGKVTATMTVLDKAGNLSRTIWDFTVKQAPGGVTSITHNVNRALQAGDTITVELRADPGTKATFDLVGPDNKAIVQSQPMTEISKGRYRGNYLVTGVKDTGTLRVVGRVVNGQGQISTAEATSAIQVLGAAPGLVTITAPVDGDKVDSPLTIKGTGLPGATVEVSIQAQGTTLLIFEYKEDLGTWQVRADAAGGWSTKPITLPKPKTVANLQFVVTAVQIDAANRRSDPVTLTVTPK